MIKNPFSKVERDNIKKNLKYLRKKYYGSLTYRKFGDKIKIAHSRISNLEAGAMPSLNDIYQYQKLFNVPYDFLLGKTVSISKVKDFGLSEEAINNIKTLQMEKDIDGIGLEENDFLWTPLDSINLLLEDINFLKMIHDYITHLIIDEDDEINYSQDLLKLTKYNIIDIKNGIREKKAKDIIDKLNQYREKLINEKENKK